MSEYEAEIQHAAVMQECVMERENVYVKRKTIYGIIKRTLDVVLSMAALVVLSPVLLIVSAAILLEDSSAAAIYRSERIGKGGRAFRMYKFRSMRKGADRLEEMLTPEELARYRRDYKLEHDPRITRVGKFIRRTSLDELPQLVNILRGDLSIVGPRPVLLEETYKYGEARERFLSVKPGLTGYWQAYARNDVGYEDGERQRMELFYVEHQNLWLDVKIVFKTVGCVVRKTGR